MHLVIHRHGNITIRHTYKNFAFPDESVACGWLSSTIRWVEWDHLSTPAIRRTQLGGQAAQDNGHCPKTGINKRQEGRHKPPGFVVFTATPKISSSRSLQEANKPFPPSCAHPRWRPLTPAPTTTSPFLRPCTLQSHHTPSTTRLLVVLSGRRQLTPSSAPPCDNTSATDAQ